MGPVPPSKQSKDSQCPPNPSTTTMKVALLLTVIASTLLLSTQAASTTPLPECPAVCCVQTTTVAPTSAAPVTTTKKTVEDGATTPFNCDKFKPGTDCICVDPVPTTPKSGAGSVTFSALAILLSGSLALLL